MDLEECIWEGPEFLSKLNVLERLYGSNALLQPFFTIVLGIRSWTIDDVIGELKHRRDEYTSAMTVSVARTIYMFLVEHSYGDQDWDKIQQVDRTRT